MKSCRALLLYLAFLTISISSHASFIILNSGAGPNGTLLDGGMDDPLFQIAGAVDPNCPTNVPAKVILDGYPIVAGTWMLNGPNSKWIAPLANQDPGRDLGGQPGPVYQFRAKFDLTGYDLATVKADGQYASDNYSIVVLNGNVVSVNTAQFQAWTPLSMTNNFLQGENIIDFYVVGIGTPVGVTIKSLGQNPPTAGTDSTGLRVELRISGCNPNKPPGFLVHPGSQRTFLGRSITLLGVVDCDEGVTYQWQRNGTTIPGAAASTYTISNFQSTDEGDYVLIASNAGGSTFSRPARLRLGVAGLFSTGVDDSGAPLNAGTTDPHWKLDHSDDTGFPGPDLKVVNDDYPGSWLRNSAQAKWIAPQANQSGNVGPVQGNAEGNYVYKLSFDTTGIDLQRIRISGRFATDNDGALFLNGNLVTAGVRQFDGWTDFQISSELVAGVNVFEARIHNGAGAGPTGLLLEVNDIVFPEDFLNPPTLQILDLSQEFGSHLRLTGAVGQTYNIQGRRTLGTPDDFWETFNTLKLESSSVEVYDPGAIGGEYRFYRAVLYP